MRFISFAVFLGVSPFLALGTWMLAKGAGNVREASASVNWPKVEAIVSRSATVSSTSRNISDRTSSTSYSADLEFRYRVNGADYTSSLRHFGQPEGSTDSSDAELIRLRYRQGAMVPLHYDPAHPGTAVAEPGFQAELLWLPGAAIFFIVPALMFLILFAGRDTPALFEAGIVIFGSIFASLGLIALIYGGWQMLRGRDSTGWPKAPGEIVYGKIDTSTSVSKAEGELISRPKRSYGAHVIYKYEVHGRAYFSNRRQFGQLSGADEEWAAEIAGKYPSGTHIPVSYLPADPHVSVLEPGLSSEAWWLPGIGVVSLLFGLAVMIFARRALSDPAPGPPPKRR